MRHLAGGTRYYTYPIGNTTNTAPTQDTLYAMPFYAPEGTAYDEIAVVCASGGASSNVRLGIYEDDNGKPGALLLDAGQVATTTGGTKSIAITQTLSGWYWLACAQQGGTPPSLTHSNFLMAADLIGVTAPFSAAFAGAYSQTGVSGALPSPWGSTLTAVARSPLLYLRAD
jgi:hypothetical protein